MYFTYLPSGVRKLKLHGSRKDLGVGSKLDPTRPRPGGSPSFCVLSPMVMTRHAGGRAEGASQ
eukprot:8722147-Alexandrium_andersonii.AAC.1